MHIPRNLFKELRNSRFMTAAFNMEGDIIVINRDLTELDFFVKKFLEVLKNHSTYLIVSGYVSISTGRTRATEDVDLLVPIMSKEKFSKLFDDLQQNGFWCYQGDDSDEVYPYVLDKLSIRFARKDELFPNIEFIPIDISRKLKFFEFSNPPKVRIKDFEFKIPPIEFEILYKEIILGSEKDFADARHLRNFFSKIIQSEKLKEFEKLIRGYHE